MEVEANRVDSTEEHLTPTEMLEKIAELDYSQSQLRNLNAEMRHWLDGADAEMAMLRSDNTTLRKQVKELEKIISDAQQVEAGPCRSLQADELDVKRCYEEKIQKLEKESTTMKEQNKKLTAELKILQQVRDQDKVYLSQLKVSLQNLESEIGETQLGLQHRDDIIDQKNMQLKFSEETVEECSTIIKDLRLMNQELRQQLEDMQDQNMFAFLNDAVRVKEGSLNNHLSFAEEMDLLASSAELRSNMSDSTLFIHEEQDAEELLQTQSLTTDPQMKRCSGVLETAVLRARRFILSVFILTILALAASRSCSGNLFSINNLWSSTYLLLQPYISVHYGAMPPI